jgi:hypothetical protein
MIMFQSRLNDYIGDILAVIALLLCAIFWILWEIAKDTDKIRQGKK